MLSRKPLPVVSPYQEQALPMLQALLLAIIALLGPVLAALSAGHALLNKRDPRSALGWVSCCILLPYLGPLVYLVFGINRTFVSAKKMRPEPFGQGLAGDMDACQDASRFPLSQIGRKVTQRRLLACESVQVLVNGDEAYPQILAAIESAQLRICLASYIFARGEIANAVIAALQNAIERGVEVRVLLDGMGESMSFPPIGLALSRAGIDFRRFNPFALFPPSLHLNMRNHRKLLVVDGLTGFAGGMNIADKNCTALHGEAAIQDVHFKVSGQIASDLEYTFMKDWQYCGGRRESEDFSAPLYVSPGPADGDTCWARLVLDGPNEDLDKLADILAGMLSSARKRIWIMTPYFLPDAELIGLLQAATLRGVDVKIVLPSSNNIPPVDWASRHLLGQLLSYDLEVYFQAPPFSHAKLLLVDDDYSLTGSANLDPRSLRLNYELNLELFSVGINQSLAQYFQQKLGSAKLYTVTDRAQRNLLVRLRDAAAWIFSPYL